MRLLKRRLMGLTFFIIAILLSLNIFARAEMVTRMVIGELITNTGCFYCYFSDTELDEIYPIYSDRLALIRYHKGSPDPDDPFYLFNPIQNNERINYYGMNGTPRFFVDGTYSNYYTEYEDSIQSRLTVKSPLVIDLSGSLDWQSKTGFVNVVITAKDDMPEYPVNVRLALTESNLFYVAPNSTVWHNQTFRGMMDDTEGDAVVMQEGGSYYFAQEFDLDSLGFVLGNCEFVAFVQDDSTKEIYQGAKIRLADMSYMPRANITIIPTSPYMIIPADGGEIKYIGIVDNNIAESDSCNVWTFISLPGGGELGPLGLYDLTLSPLESVVDSNVVQEIPYYAPAGTYRYRAYVGHYPDVVYDSSSFEFQKAGESYAGEYSDYELTGWRRNLGGSDSEPLMDNERLSCYPNPFNPAAEIVIQLQTEQDVQLDIFNILGKKVETLLKKRLSAGGYSVRWDGHNFPSGVYFARLIAGDKTSTVKMVLLK